MISKTLENNPKYLTIWISMAAFCSYFCMYMIRKPYTAATFEGMLLGSIDLKTLLVLSQVIGYAISKFIGISFISSLNQQYRIHFYVGLNVMAFLCLCFLSFSDQRLAPLFLFTNGLLLGLVWGVVFSFLEGRKNTEIYTVMLSANYIFSSAFAKSAGMYVLNLGVLPQHMPMVTAAFIMPLLLLSSFMLKKIPSPNADDIAQREIRKPLNTSERKLIIKKYIWIVLLFVIIYMFLTIIRDIRDNFNIEIWDQLGYKNQSSIYTLSELPATALVLILLALLFKIKSNFKAVHTHLLLSIFGFSLIFITTQLYLKNFIEPVYWMISTGIGLFIPYILFNGIFFDRLIALFSIGGNVGFLMYLADSFGYLSSVSVFLLKIFYKDQFSWYHIFTNMCNSISLAGIALTCLLYFAIKNKNMKMNETV